MRIALTGATGFLGRYLVAHLTRAGHSLRCWTRPMSDRADMQHDEGRVEWCPGQLGERDSADALVRGCDAVVHAALHHPGGGYRGGEGDIAEFVTRNIVGTIQLIEAARAASAGRFVFISTCAVHEIILSDRPLDEAHPLWPTSHYGAHKAAIEKFVHSYGLGTGYDICSLRPTGIYGLAHPVERSKWFELVRAVGRGQPVQCERGGKEVHAADVARAVEILLTAPSQSIRGQAFNCYDMYVSQYDVAMIAKRATGSRSEITGEPKRPQHQISTEKIRALGMRFGGQALLESTVRQLIDAAAEIE